VNKPSHISVAITRPDDPEAVGLIGELDAYLSSLYPPECNHLLSVEELLNPNVSFVIAKANGTAAGCGALVNHGDYGEIKRMYVRPEFRGQGISVKILNALEEKAREQGFKIIRLETGFRQFEAIRLYGREGYKRCGVFGEYADNMVSLFFEKSI
jgi:putative acetyltransferase